MFSLSQKHSCLEQHVTVLILLYRFSLTHLLCFSAIDVLNIFAYGFWMSGGSCETVNHPNQMPFRSFLYHQSFKTLLKWIIWSTFFCTSLRNTNFSCKLDTFRICGLNGTTKSDDMSSTHGARPDLIHILAHTLQ